MFLETADGDLVNTKEIVIIKKAGDANEEFSAHAELRNGDVCLLKRSMMDIRHLVADVIPAAPGFYVVTPDGYRQGVIGWKRTHACWVPVTLDPIVGEECVSVRDDWCAVQSPDGSVLAGGHPVSFSNETEWKEWDMRQQRSKNGRL
jgi:hypothetical protein